MPLPHLAEISLAEMAAHYRWPTLHQVGKDWGFVQGVLLMSDTGADAKTLEEALGAAWCVGMTVGRTKARMEVNATLSTVN